MSGEPHTGSGGLPPEGPPPDRPPLDGPLPEWLRPLVAAAARAGSSDLGRWAVVPADARSAAVLVLFGYGSAGSDLLLIERSEALRNHAGQPAFPGGAADPGDGGPADTALREAVEEVGLDRSGVAVVALLPELYLPPTGFAVTPVIGWWHASSAVFPADPAEVARVERVPLAELADPANRFRVWHPSGMVGPAFQVRGMTVWGFTAGLIDWLLVLGGWARPWNVDDVRPLPRRAVELAARGRRPGWPGPDEVRPADQAAPPDDTVAPYEPDVPYQPEARYSPNSRYQPDPPDSGGGG